MARYDTVLFDADNTLFDFTKSEHDALLDALRSVGVNSTENMVTTYSAINREMWERLERGEIGKNELRVARFAVFCDRYDIKTDVRVLAEAYTEFLSQKACLIDGAIEVCRQLTEADVSLYIITNGLKLVQDRRFYASVLPAFFKKVFISEEIGFEKPRVEFFDAVRQGICPFHSAKTLVIGDSLTSDIQGGINAGLDTCWYNPGKKSLPERISPTYTVARLAEIPALVL